MIDNHDQDRNFELEVLRLVRFKPIHVRHDVFIRCLISDDRVNLLAQVLANCVILGISNILNIPFGDCLLFVNHSSQQNVRLRKICQLISKITTLKNILCHESF